MRPLRPSSGHAQASLEFQQIHGPIIDYNPIFKLGQLVRFCQEFFNSSCVGRLLQIRRDSAGKAAQRFLAGLTLLAQTVSSSGIVPCPKFITPAPSIRLYGPKQHRAILYLIVLLAENPDNQPYNYSYMQDNSEGRRNQKLESLRGKIKLTLPSFSPMKRRSSLALHSGSFEVASQQMLPSPQAFDSKAEGLFSSLDIEKFYLKNVFQQKYDILQKLGEGANGVVKKCKSKTTGEIFAVKIGRMQEEHVVALKRIVLTMRRIRHDNILKMKELYVDSKRSKYYQVIEYLPFPSLKSLISRGYKFISSTIEKIMKQLLQALEYFHKHHIVHRDIKTSNILYDSEKEKLYVIDLGIITKTVQRDKRRNLWTNTGTLEYKAPEMLEGSSYNQSVDVWAAGVVLYELIEGKTPFREQTQMDTIESIRQIKYKFTAELWVDIPLAKLLVTRLLKPKGQRLTASAALKDPWFQLMGFEYKPPPKPQSSAKHKQQVPPPATVLRMMKMASYGIHQSGAVRKTSHEDDGEIVLQLTTQSGEHVRVSSYQTRIKSNLQVRISVEEMDKMLSTELERDIINNNN